MQAFIYHYCNNKGFDPLEDRINPVLLSIASLRNYNPQSAVYIIDSSPKKQKWNLYKELDFKVLKSEPSTLSQKKVSVESMRRLWAFTDCGDIKENVMALVSCNLIFLDDPRKMDYGIFDSLVGGDREGLVYYNRQSKKASWALRLWQGLCTLASQDGSFLDALLEFNSQRIIDEHTVMSYLVEREGPLGWAPIHYKESVPFFHLLSPGVASNIRSVCLVEGYVGFDKVRVIKAFEETYKAISQVSWIDRLGIPETRFSLDDMAVNFETVRKDLAAGQPSRFVNGPFNGITQSLEAVKSCRGYI
jgi:hypothetical protein